MKYLHIVSYCIYADIPNYITLPCDTTTNNEYQTGMASRQETSATQNSTNTGSNDEACTEVHLSRVSYGRT